MTAKLLKTSVYFFLTFLVGNKLIGSTIMQNLTILKTNKKYILKAHFSGSSASQKVCVRKKTKDKSSTFPLESTGKQLEVLFKKGRKKEVGGINFFSKSRNINRNIDHPYLVTLRELSWTIDLPKTKGSLYSIPVMPIHISAKCANQKPFRVKLNTPKTKTFKIKILQNSETRKPKTILLYRKPFDTTFNHMGIEYNYIGDRDFVSSLIKTTIKSSETFNQWFGPYRKNKIYILENPTTVLSDLDQIILISKPRQHILKSLQERWLNWLHWSLTSQLSYQWWFSAIQKTESSNYWLTAGILDFVNEIALNQNSLRTNLFNNFDTKLDQASLSYRDYQNLTASILQRRAPGTVVTDTQFKSKPHASSIAYIRQVFLLRSLRLLLGKSTLQNFLKKIRESSNIKELTPIAFLQVMSLIQANKNSGPLINELIENWWTTSKWPDFYFDKYTTTKIGPHWLTKIKVNNTANFNSPIELTATHKNQTLARVSATEIHKPLSIITHLPPTNLIIDAKKSLYDLDRFNNQLEIPKFNFFPGSARKFADDAYTILWFPYLLKRPGEGMSLGISSEILEYTNSRKSLTLEHHQNNKIDLKMFSQYWLAQQKTQGTFFLNKSKEGYQTLGIEATKIMRPESPLPITVSVGLKLRGLENKPNSNHPTGSFAILMQPKKSKYLCLETSFSLEKSASNSGIQYDYQRYLATIEADIRTDSLGLIFRAFYGSLASKKYPESATFQPQTLTEAKIRIDENSLERSEGIRSINTDMFFPLSLPINPNTMVLPNSIEGRLFYDQGWTSTPSLALKSFGAGFNLPLGGDVVGVGPVSLTNITLLAVLWKKVDDTESQDPTILFDFTGEL